MKLKIIVAILAIAGIFSLAGCKPKETNTTLSGQVFIVTQGAENVKLGDLEILLVETSQTTDFLKKKRSFIESELASRDLEITNAQREVDAALENSKRVQADAELFEAKKSYKTNAEYVKIYTQWEGLKRQYLIASNNLSKYVAQQKAVDVAAADKFDSFLAKREQREQLAEKCNSLHDQMDVIKGAALAAERGKVEVARSKLAAAKSELATAEKRFRSFPTAKDYLGDFSPTEFQKTRTDAEGKFSITYPRNKALTVFARAQRSLQKGTELYYWLVAAPANAETAQILLSNNNLVHADPAGYFKIKPKASLDESP